MAKVITSPQAVGAVQQSSPTLLRDAGLVLSATAFLAACAHVSLPIGPVPLTLQNFGVLLLGLLLGPNRAAAALVLYLTEGGLGLPVFNPSGPGGIAQLFLSPTSGFLLSYPVVAYMAGFINQRFGRTLKAAVTACAAAEFLLFVAGAAYFRALVGIDLAHTLQAAVLPFLPGEVLKVAAAASISSRWHAWRRH
jgi:biotin transport system substrate-specific component